MNEFPLNKDINLVPDKEKDAESNIHQFKLPIEYLDTCVVHKLSNVVVNDLELVSASSSPCMYDILLNPKHIFAKNMIEKWKNSFSSDIDFLKQTQQVISNTKSNQTPIDCESLTNICPSLFYHYR